MLVGHCQAKVHLCVLLGYHCACRLAKVHSCAQALAHKKCIPVIRYRTHWRHHGKPSKCTPMGRRKTSWRHPDGHSTFLLHLASCLLLSQIAILCTGVQLLPRFMNVLCSPPSQITLMCVGGCCILLPSSNLDSIVQLTGVETPVYLFSKKA